MQTFRKLLDEQQNYIAHLLTEHKAEVDEKIDVSKKHTFRQKNLEKQFEITEKIGRLNKKIKREVKTNNIEKALDAIKEQEETIDEHQEDLITADSCKFGWLTVQKLKNTSSLPSAQLRKIEKIEALIERTKLPTYNGRSFKKPYEVEKGFFNKSLRTTRPTQKKSPEQLLEEATKQTRAGAWGHCQEEGHFYRECPAFWEKVKQSRREHLGQN